MVERLPQGLQRRRVAIVASDLLAQAPFRGWHGELSLDQDGMADRDLGLGEQEADRWCQMQDQFLARARQAIEQTRRDGTGI